MILVVPLAGEVKFYPLNDTFWLSFGAPTIFFFLLLLKNISPILPVFLTASALVVFRVLLDFFFMNETDMIYSFLQHCPTFFFYFTFASLFQLIKIRLFLKSSLMIGFIGKHSPIHAGGGGHGSLHEDDSLTPLIIVGTDSKPENNRLVDFKN